MTRQLFLGLIGLCAGSVTAAGVFAFLVMIGVFPRLIGKTSTKKHILLYETVIIVGGVLGNISDWHFYRLPVHVPGGDAEGPSNGYQAPPPGGGTSLADSGPGAWKADRLPDLFYQRFWIKCRNWRKCIWKSIKSNMESMSKK